MTITLTGTIEEEIRERISGTPTEPIFDPQHETIIRCDIHPDDISWCHTFRWWLENRPGKHPVVQIPGRRSEIGTQLTLADSPPYPPQYWDRIGQSGWNHVKRHARYISFEFDSSSNHSEGISDTDMQFVISSLSQYPYVDLRRSTSGRGLHVRLYISPVPCKSRSEYLHIRKAVLSDFADQVDFPLSDWADLGGRANLWLWAGGEA